MSTDPRVAEEIGRTLAADGAIVTEERIDVAGVELTVVERYTGFDETGTVAAGFIHRSSTDTDVDRGEYR